MKELVDGIAGANRHILIEGGSGSGKSLVARDIAFQRAQKGEEVNVLDPHKPETWKGVGQVFAREAGADFGKLMLETLRSREAASVEANAKGEKIDFKPITFAMSDFAAIAKDFPQLKAAMQTVMTEGRKFNIAVLAETAGFNASEIGAGTEAMRRSFGKKLMMSGADDPNDPFKFKGALDGEKVRTADLSSRITDNPDLFDPSIVRYKAAAPPPPPPEPTNRIEDSLKLLNEIGQAIGGTFGQLVSIASDITTKLRGEGNGLYPTRVRAYETGTIDSGDAQTALVHPGERVESMQGGKRNVGDKPVLADLAPGSVVLPKDLAEKTRSVPPDQEPAAIDSATKELAARKGRVWNPTKDTTYEGVPLSEAASLSAEQAREALAYREGMTTVRGSNQASKALPDATRPDLDEYQRGALQKYSYLNDRPLNALLRGKSLEETNTPYGKSFYDEMNAQMESAFAKTPVLDKPVRVVRGMQMPDDVLAGFIEKIQGASKDNKPLAMSGYTSTARPTGLLASLGLTSGIPKPFRGNVSFAIDAVHGIDMKPHSQLPGESEMLLPNMSQFTVKGIKKTKGGYHIELAQLPPSKHKEDVVRLKSGTVSSPSKAMVDPGERVVPPTDQNKTQLAPPPRPQPNSWDVDQNKTQLRMPARETQLAPQSQVPKTTQLAPEGAMPAPVAIRVPELPDVSNVTILSADNVNVPKAADVKGEDDKDKDNKSKDGISLARLASITPELIKGFNVINNVADGMAKKYGDYSPQIAQAQAMAEIKMEMGNLRRAQESGSELAEYVKAQSELQNQWEDVKVEIMKKVVPVLTGILGVLSSLLGIASKVKDEEKEDPTSVILGNFFRDPSPSALNMPEGRRGI